MRVMRIAVLAMLATGTILIPTTGSSAHNNADHAPAAGAEEGHTSPPDKIRIATMNIREGFIEKPPETSPTNEEDRCYFWDANYDPFTFDREPSEDTADCGKEMWNLWERMEYLVHDETPNFPDFYPDVILLQEANRDSSRLLAGLLNNLPGANYAASSPYSPSRDPISEDPGGQVPDCGGETGVFERDSHIVYNSATVSFEPGGELALKYPCSESQIANPGAPSADQKKHKVAERMAPYGLVTELATGQQVAVMSAHALARDRIADPYQSNRWKQWATNMRQALFNRYPSVDSRVVGGDFNHKMCSSMAVSSDETAACTKNAWWAELAAQSYRDVVHHKTAANLANQGTTAAGTHRIDFLFYQGDEICQASVDNETGHLYKYVNPDTGAPLFERYITDHRPVFSTIHISGAC